MKIVTTAVAATLLAACLAPTQPDPYEGTWVLNLARSGGEPRTQVLTIQIADDQETYRSELVSADGRRQVTTYTAAYDGEEYPSRTVVTDPPSEGGSSTSRDDTVILRKIDERTRERHWRQGGRVVRILRRVVSEDGQVLTSRVVDVDERGQETLTSTLVFDKTLPSGASGEAHEGHE